MTIKLRLDRAAMAALMASEPVAAAVTGRAEAVADRVGTISAHDRDVKATVTPYTTQLQGAAVDIKHAAGLAMEAKHGYLTNAAASVGLTVKGKK